MSTKNIVITGAAGGIGSVLIPELLALGHCVTAIDDCSSGNWGNIQNHERLSRLTGSILDENFMKKSPFGEANVVIHLAAISSLPKCQSDPSSALNVNLLGTVRVAEASRKSENLELFINASTSAVYENSESSVLVENETVFPNLIYSQSKLFAEQYLAGLRSTSGFPAISLRFFNVFGPMQDYKRTSPPLINYLIRETFFGRNPVLHSDGTQTRDYISVEDITRAIVIAIRHSKFKSNVYNLCRGEQISVADIVQIARDTFQLDIKPIYKPADLLWANYPELFKEPFSLRAEVVGKETVKCSLGSYEKFSSETGWKPTEDLHNQLSAVMKQTWQHISVQEN